MAATCPYIHFSSRIGFVTLLFFFQPTFLAAQRVFVTKAGALNRSYLFYSNVPETFQAANRPLVIVLHKPGETARDAFNRAKLASFKTGVAMIFPNSQSGWTCDNDTEKADLAFIDGIISDTYSNFHIDRNRVYVLADEMSGCFVKTLINTYQGKISNSRLLSSIDTDLPGAIEELASVPPGSNKENQYTLWTAPFGLKKMSPLDSLKGYRFHNRWVLDFQMGGIGMFGFVKTGIKDGTYMDLSKAHSFLDISITKWMSDSVAWFADLGWLKVPQKMEMDGEKIKVGGGIITPLTLGIKYAIFRSSFFYPYLSLGGGMMFIMTTGGRFNKASLGTGMPSLTYGSRYTPHLAIGSGLNMRMSKRIVLGVHLRYLHSAKFKSLGNIDAIRGVNATGSFGFILNANSLRKKPFSMDE